MSAPFQASSADQAETLRFVREIIANDEEFSDEDRAKLGGIADEMEHYFTQAIRIHERVFADLPAVANIRARWKSRAIAEDDPLLLMLEVMSIVDARSQLQMSQFTNVVHSFAKMAHVYAVRIRQAAEEVNASRLETARYAADLVKAQAYQSALNKSLEAYGKELPELIDAMGACHRVADTNTWQAKTQLMAIGAVVAVVGFLLGALCF